MKLLSMLIMITMITACGSGGGDLNLKVMRDGVEVINQDITQDNQTIIVTDNI